MIAIRSETGLRGACWTTVWTNWVHKDQQRLKNLVSEVSDWLIFVHSVKKKDVTLHHA